MEDFEKFKNNSNDSIELGIKILKKIYDLKSQQKHLTINSIEKTKSTLTYNSKNTKSSFDSYLESQRKIHDQSSDSLRLLSLTLSNSDSKKFQSNDTPNGFCWQIKQTADNNRLKMLNVHRVIKSQLDASKHENSNKENKLYVIHDVKNFEVYCLMNHEINKAPPLLPIYAGVKENWRNHIAEFYSVFQSVQNWGEIKDPIEIDGSLDPPKIEMKLITFKEDWYVNKVESSAIDAVESGLARIFNRMLELNPKYAHTILKKNSPYQCDDYKPRINLMRNILGTAGKTPKKEVLLYTDNILVTAGGLDEFSIQSIDLDDEDNPPIDDDENYLEENGLDPDDIDFELVPSMSIHHSAGRIANNKRKLDNSTNKISDPKKKIPTTEIKGATLEEAKKSLFDLNNAINMTTKTSSEFFSQFDQLVESMGHKSSLLFNQTEQPPLYVYEWQFDEMIGRIDSLLSRNQNNMDLLSIRKTLSLQHQRLIAHKNANPKRTPYFITEGNLDLISKWGEVFYHVDKHVTEIKKLTVIKINEFDPDTNIVTNVQDTFVVDHANKIMEYKVDPNAKNAFIQSLYKTEFDDINKNIAKLSHMKEILTTINDALNNLDFKAWFCSSTPLMSIRRKFYKYNDNTIDQVTKIHNPGMRTGDLTSSYYDDLFDATRSTNIILKFNDKEFNEAIRGYYANPLCNNFKIEGNNPSFVDHTHHNQNALSAGTFYPACFVNNCKINWPNHLIHYPNLEVRPVVKLMLEVTGLHPSITVPNLIIIQSIKDTLHFSNDKFDLDVFDKQIEILNDRIKDLKSLEARELKVKFDIFAGPTETMQPILSKANIDRSLAKRQDSLTVTKGSSGSGKTFTINGNGADKKGFFEAISYIDQTLFSINLEIFEQYHIAMPFEESFQDSKDNQFSIPLIWRYDINPNTYHPSSIETKDFKVNSQFPIQSFIKNYSRKDGSGIRKDIDDIRKSIGRKEFATIRSTKNNIESSRSTLIQALKINSIQNQKDSTYNLIIDRPGDEEPVSTFDLKNQQIAGFSSEELLLSLNNPIIGFLNKYNKGDNDLESLSWDCYFNAVNIIKLKQNQTFIEYFEQILEKKFIVHPRTFNTTANLNSSDKSLSKTKTPDEYVTHQLMADLNDFTKNNSSILEIIVKNRFKELFALDPKILNFIKNIHKNTEWLNFTIKCNKFKEFGNASQNLLLNGFSKESIQIKDLFTMPRILNALRKHNSNHASEFLDFFGADDFFHQIQCPLLGTINSFKYLKYSDKNLKLAYTDIEVHSNKIFFLADKQGLFYHSNHLNMQQTKDDQKIGFKDEEYELSLELYVAFSQYGNQSYLNTYTGISNFLMATAFYFAVFKNPDYVDYYDQKIKTYYNIILGGEFEKVRGFFEAVSINEINNNQYTLSDVFRNNQSKQNITFNELLTNAMKYYNDLILPKIGIYEEYERASSIVNHFVIDFTRKQRQELTLRMNRLHVIFRTLEISEKERAIKVWEEQFRYQMTRVFNTDIGWLSVENNKFEESSNYYIKGSQLLEVFVFNPYVEKKPSGRSACLSIVHNMLM